MELYPLEQVSPVLGSGEKGREGRDNVEWGRGETGGLKVKALLEARATGLGGQIRPRRRRDCVGGLHSIPSPFLVLIYQQGSTWTCTNNIAGPG